MSTPELFPQDKVVGVFRGFSEGGLEFRADLVLPYRNDFQNLPMHGQFLLVQLESPNEAVLGRITAFASEGRLTTGSGEDFSIRAMQESREIPEDLRLDYLRYKVAIRVLGVLRIDDAPLTGRATPAAITFIASHRRLPHVGSRVAFPTGEVLREIAGHNVEGAVIGHLALGEYIYADQYPEARAGRMPRGSPEDARAGVAIEPWMQFREPEVQVRFPISSLVSRRTFVFARAGFGKSNLNKLLFSTLYESEPTVTKRGGRQVPVGTVLFDPDGEYFWPDDKGRPGLADVPGLRDRLVVFTGRQAPSAFYKSFVAGGIRLDIRTLRADVVIGITLSPERQEQQNVRKLAGLSPDKWTNLVNLIQDKGNEADLGAISAILALDTRQDMEAIAARSNMTTIVRMLHDPSSTMLEMLLSALTAGKLCVIDVSMLRGAAAMALSGIILRKIFEHNQEQFTRADSQTIPTIAVIEEAQSVLNGKATSHEPFVEWVKEGRKYDLGAVMITQQPGSIPSEILSQGDNWFLFHLLSSNDLVSVKRANAHFSDDLLSVLLNEPIPGQGVFWSSAGGKSYPVPMRALSFEGRHTVQDPTYTGDAIETYASRLRAATEAELAKAAAMIEAHRKNTPTGPSSRTTVPGPVDLGSARIMRAVEALRANRRFMDAVQRQGEWWGTVAAIIQKTLPDTMGVGLRYTEALTMVRPVLVQLFGEENVNWKTEKRANANGEQKVWIQVIGQPDTSDPHAGGGNHEGDGLVPHHRDVAHHVFGRGPSHGTGNAKVGAVRGQRADHRPRGAHCRGRTHADLSPNLD